MKKDITTVFEKTIKQFRTVLANFTEEQINEIPFEASWTAAQVADHVLKSQSGFSKLIGGEQTEANRRADEKKEILAKIFLDFNSKLQSPAFILPSSGPFKRNDLLQRIDETSKEMVEAIENNDLHKICLGFELPNLGRLTGIEWCWFQIYHTQRHTNQLENIYGKIGKREL